MGVPIKKFITIYNIGKRQKFVCAEGAVEYGAIKMWKYGN